MTMTIGLTMGMTGNRDRYRDRSRNLSGTGAGAVKFQKWAAPSTLFLWQLLVHTQKFRCMLLHFYTTKFLPMFEYCNVCAGKT